MPTISVRYPKLRGSYKKTGKSNEQRVIANLDKAIEEHIEEKKHSKKGGKIKTFKI